MVEVTWTVESSGAVSQVQVSSSTLNASGTENCIRSAVRRWRFPKPEGSMPFITYPFQLKPR